ncbi:MAG: NosD domain-containing protein [Candidatus Thorarchaeota archaeon]
MYFYAQYRGWFFGLNTIRGNKVSYNTECGIYCRRAGHYNNIYFNNFTGNGQNAIDDSMDGNQWNNATIGNYWSNYTGTDADVNGIGDTPYDVPPVGGSVDNYPIWDDGDDPTPPELSIVEPFNDTVIGSKSPVLEISSKSLYINTTWYNLNGTSVNYIFSGLTGIINQSAWDQFNDEYVSIIFYINDSLGNENSVIVLVEKDITIPIIIIYSPEDNEAFTKFAPAFNITIIEEHLESCWYTIDGGINNFTILLIKLHGIMHLMLELQFRSMFKIFWVILDIKKLSSKKIYTIDYYMWKFLIIYTHSSTLT